MEIGKQGIGAGQNMRHELIVGRGLDEFCVHHAVKENLASAVGTRGTDQAVLEFRRNRRLGIPFHFFVRGGLRIDCVALGFLEECVKGTHRLVREAEFLRQVRLQQFLLQQQSVRFP